MSIFSRAENKQAYFKAGLFGFEGSGKTMTSCLIAIGLHHLIKSTKPVFFFDTETGSDYMIPLFSKAGIELRTVKSRALATLADAIKEAEANGDILILDSLTHIYNETITTYKQAKKRGSYIDIRDWGPIKETIQRNFSTPYVNSKLHFIWCSRAKNLFEDMEDEDASEETGKRRFKPVKIGTAARAENESSYEPSLLIEMTREYTGDGGKYVRKAHVIKDRFNVIDSQDFEFAHFDSEKLSKEQLWSNPTFQAFLPHIQRLNLGGVHVGFQEETSEALFQGGDRDIQRLRQRQKIAWEQIENTLGMVFPGGTGKDKQARFAVLSELTGTTSETEIEQQHPDKLEPLVATINKLGQRFLDGWAYGSLLELREEVRRLHATQPMPKSEAPEQKATSPAPGPFDDPAAWGQMVETWKALPTGAEAIAEAKKRMHIPPTTRTEQLKLSLREPFANTMGDLLKAHG